MAFDTGFTLIPADQEITVDELLEAALSGTLPDSTDDPPPKPLGRGWAFDFNTGQFVAHGSSPAAVDGLEQLKTWIAKALQTARFAHPIYSEDFGVEDPWESFGKLVTPAMTGKMVAKATAALMVHDRITQVTDFTFDHDPTSSLLFVSFRVVVDENQQLDIERLVLGRAL